MGEFDNQHKVYQKVAGGKVKRRGMSPSLLNDIISINSLLKINPPPLKGGEKRQGTTTTAALVYLMDRAEQTED